jgi:membrane-bound lytic murein transglycosylase F
MLLLISCGGRNNKALSADVLDSAQQVEDYDLSEIETAGELIAVTISGPETYYQYHGRDLGLQYALAENFANSMGLRLRMEIAQDTTELYQMLLRSKADLIAYPLPKSTLQKMGVEVCGMKSADGKSSWSVRKKSPDLAEALNSWYKPGLLAEVTHSQKTLLSTPYIHRHARAVFLNRTGGVISSYDAFFARAAAQTRWDWRLIAAQCYQESAFDPEATSWAGARGLMQIMPSTAAQLGLGGSSLNNPETNIAAAARYINMLQNKFSDVRDPLERQKFVLAAYNGGFYHIRDAMRLAQKYHRNPQSWDAVSFYVLHLTDPHYYRDPVVRSGYMIGSETYNYVYQILDRWADYRGVAHSSIPYTGDLHFDPEKAHRVNRFTRHNDAVQGRTDSIFRIQ